ncbi:hypothetical protein B6N58_11760 [Legionella micdadei]|uniref:Uncharacterized protein n=1 Tax=Legionella micdadei TaxID=451 RepID=A0A098GC26_LEGMI|nr:hypothetical protein B6N58_11760 [Legionella micdadei]CEG60053.1 protein of unknown function [Legionella micdadei]
MGLIFLVDKANSPIDQLLNDNFYQNPAKSIKLKFNFLAGNIFIKPKLNFTGITSLGFGKTTSKPHDSLPYILTAYRITERFVLGINQYGLSLFFIIQSGLF